MKTQGENYTRYQLDREEEVNQAASNAYSRDMAIVIASHLDDAEIMKGPVGDGDLYYLNFMQGKRGAIEDLVELMDENGPGFRALVEEERSKNGRKREHAFRADRDSGNGDDDRDPFFDD